MMAEKAAQWIVDEADRSDGSSASRNTVSTAP
jgi:hypothetical protein